MVGRQGELAALEEMMEVEDSFVGGEEFLFFSGAVEMLKSHRE